MQSVMPRPALPGLTRHDACEHLHRHRHNQAFAAVVLKGGYVEAGDSGEHLVEAGDVLVHRPFECHLNRFDPRGAEVLVLPVSPQFRGKQRGRTCDPELLAQAARRSLRDAAEILLETFTEVICGAHDWPSLLARDLSDDPALDLTIWAAGMGLHPGSLSRGFRQVFAITPARFRLIQRAHKALDRLSDKTLSLGEVAIACGFADQAHMSRTIVQFTGLTPLAHRVRNEASTR